jgi:hypothetical protein
MGIVLCQVIMLVSFFWVFLRSISLSKIPILGSSGRCQRHFRQYQELLMAKFSHAAILDESFVSWKEANVHGRLAQLQSLHRIS